VQDIETAFDSAALLWQGAPELIGRFKYHLNHRKA
jgi:hypothetical protein